MNNLYCDYIVIIMIIISILTFVKSSIIVVFLAFTGWQAWMVRLSAKLQKEALAFTDERAKLEGELIAGIEVVKCNAWEVCISAATPPRVLTRGGA